LKSNIIISVSAFLLRNWWIFFSVHVIAGIQNNFRITDDFVTISELSMVI
jgi:hypothetical protein